MSVPNTFASATTSIPLANLDANFAYYDAGFSLSGSAVTFAGSITLTTGTANGVPYLNASKVLTSGSVLTFDGTTLSSTKFAGALNGTVGATTANTGAFTSLTASTTLGVTGVSTLTGGALIQGLTVGRGAGAVSTNTAVGASALEATTSAVGCTAVGHQAGKAITTGGYNSIFGRNAALLTDTGAFNSVFGAADGSGAAALRANVSGNYNCAFGGGALALNTASNNTAVGLSALYSNTTAGNSSAVGYNAGYLSTGIGNQFFGYSSGSAVTTGAKNVILGSYTGSAAPISATGSNFVVLSDGDGNVRQYFNGANATFNGSISAAGDLSLTGTNRVITLPGDASTSSGSIKFTTPIYGADTGASYGSNGNTARILFTSSLGFYGGATLSAATQVMDLSSSGNLGIGTTANASAILDAQSTTKGVRMPNMTTTQKNAIATPAAGLMVFDTTLAKLCVYSGAAWQTITSV